MTNYYYITNLRTQEILRVPYESEAELWRIEGIIEFLTSCNGEFIAETAKEQAARMHAECEWEKLSECERGCPYYYRDDEDCGHPYCHALPEDAPCNYENDPEYDAGDEWDEDFSDEDFDDDDDLFPPSEYELNP